MKVFFRPDGHWRVLRRRMELEGDTIVDGPETNPAQLVLHEPVLVPSIALGPVAPTLEGPGWFISRWFNGKGFHHQALLGVEVSGLMNHDLGAKVVAGSYLCFVDGEKLDHLFERGRLVEFLQEACHVGWVTLFMKGLEPYAAQTGVPQVALPGIFECTTEKVSTYLAEGSGHLDRTCWSGTLLVSKHPYPAQQKTTTPAVVEGLCTDLEKHFWPYDHRVFRSTLTTHGTALGLVSAWSKRSPTDVFLRCEQTAWNLTVPEKQFRTDAWYAMRDTIEWIKERELVKFVDPYQYSYTRQSCLEPGIGFVRTGIGSGGTRQGPV